MGTLLGLMFLTFVMNAKFEAIQGFVYSSPDTALGFAQCLIEKMSESQFFTIEDRNSIMEVANVMAEAMKHRYQTNISIKILVIAFVTSMADVIIHEDPAKNTHRKGVYASSLEQCSMSSAGYVDPEFLMEALRIVASIERSKKSRITKGDEAVETNPYNSNKNIQQPNAHNPLAVQPSPVQVQRNLENFNPNPRTSFERPFNSYPPTLNSGPNPQFNPQGMSGFSSDSKPVIPLQTPNFDRLFLGANPESILQATANTGLLPRSNGGSLLQAPPNTGFPLGSYARSMTQVAAQTGFSFGSNVGSGLSVATNKGFSPMSNVGSSLQQGNDKVIFPFSHSSQKEENRHSPEPYKVASNSGSLNIPQTKESSIVVIPPSGNRGVDQTQQLQNNPLLKSGETRFQPLGLDNAPVPQEAIAPSAYFPQTGERTLNDQSDPAFERTIQDILMESTTFRNTFNFDIPQQNAINLARSLTEQSLKDYNLDLVTKAVGSVSEEVAKVSYQTPENYALALSNALVNVLKLHNFPLFVDGARIANAFLSNLDTTKRISSQPADPVEQPNSSGSINPEEKPTDIDFQSPPQAPEDAEGERFSEVLRKCLTETNEFASFFCSDRNPEVRTKIIFTVIKLSLHEYGPQVSSLAASVASGALAEQSAEGLCSNYAQIISDGISQALDENADIKGANAQDISSKLIFNLNQQIQILEKSDTGSDRFPVEHSRVEPYNIMPTLQTSLPNNENDTSVTPEFNQTSVYEEMNYGTLDDVPGQIFDADSALYVFSGPSSPIEMSPVEKPNPENDEYTTPFTTPYSTEISDELTSATSLTETIIDLWEMSSTESPDNAWASNDTINPVALASHLLESFESALGAFLDTSDLESSSNFSDTSLGTSKSVEDSESDISPINVEQIAPQLNINKNSRKRQRIERRRKKRTSISDVVTPSIIETETEVKSRRHSPQSASEEETEVDKSSDYDSSDSSTQQKTGSESIVKGENKSFSYSEDSRGKADFVELQPSFQGPPSADTPSNQTSTPKFDTNVHNTESKELSLLVAKSVSQKAAEAIAYIRSGNFKMVVLCERLNELAPIVNIPPLDYCMEIPAIDYLLNVLGSTIKITSGV